jgi:hypothetical protein
MNNFKVLWLKEQKICSESYWKTQIAISKLNVYCHVTNVIISEVPIDIAIPLDLRWGCVYAHIHIYVCVCAYLYLCVCVVCWSFVHPCIFCTKKTGE